MRYFYLKEITVFLLIACSLGVSQEFNVSPLISLPGWNGNFEVKKNPDSTGFGGDVAISFENYSDSLYSICLQRIEPYSDEIIIITSDSIPKNNPDLTWLDNEQIRIVWQQLIADKWQIFSRIVIGDSLTPSRQLTNSAQNNTNPQVWGDNLIWINDLYLTYAQISDSLVNIKKIDGSDCSDPNMQSQQLNVLYEQQVDSLNNIIKEARYINNENHWALKKLVSRGSNKNPRYSSWPQPPIYTYQKLDTVWKSFSADLYENSKMWESSNHNYNVSNPFYFYYPIPTKKYIRDWFVVYESDSLDNNKEIMIELPIYLGSAGGKNNLSNMIGDDIKPYVALLGDTVAVIWEHIEDGESQIYWARAPFKAHTGIDENFISSPAEFALRQNYPNPFNPSTTIEFYAPRAAKATLRVFDINGRNIKTLISSEIHRGLNRIVWNGKNENGTESATGIYFYVLKYGHKSLSKKMLLLR